jgi:PKD repeat protein
VGVASLAAGSTRIANLAAVSSASTDSTVGFSIASVPTGGGAYETLIGRQVGSAVYAAHAWVKAGGAVALVLKQGGVVLSNTVVTGLTYTAGSTLNLRLQVTGTSPTTVRAKLWPAATTEPTAWLSTVTDSTAALQAAGSVGLQTNLSSSASSGIVTSFDNYLVQSVGTVTPPVNQAPSATFSTSVTGLAATVNASASSDPDGTITGYAWNYGDGTTGSGATSSHTYAAAGTFTVTLTVTDNGGATATTTRAVTTTVPASTVFASDTFDRTVSGGWGSAPTGGAWTITGAAAALSVSGGAGVVTLPAGSTRSAVLGSVTKTAADLQSTVSLDAVPTGSGAYATIVGRQVGTATYTASAWIKAGGAVALVIKQGSTVLSNTVVPGLTYTAGAKLQVRMQASGTNPTTLRAKIWLASAAEPSAWLSTVTDSTAALQAAGTMGLQAYLSGSATSAGVFRFDTLTAKVPE